MQARVLAVAAALGLLSVAMPAGAQHPSGGPHPTFRTENAFFTCTGDSKLQNSATSGPSGWSTAAPAASIGSGAGCVVLDPNLLVTGGTAQDNIYDAVFAGTFVGNLKALTVKLHNAVLGRARTTAPLTLRIRLAIDGEQLFTTYAAAKLVTVTPVVAANGITEYLEFSIQNLGFANYIYDSQGKLADVVRGGIANDEGDGTTRHSIMISVDTFTSPTQGAWVIGASEVPAGITFNPATLAAAKITSPLPQGPPA